jgi:hypothetical protein
MASMQKAALVFIIPLVSFHWNNRVNRIRGESNMSQKIQAAPSASEIERLFTEITAALCVAVKLNEVRITSDGRGCIILSRDSYGRLPNIQIAFSNNKDTSLDQICLDIARLAMIGKFRQELAELHYGCSFLRPIYKRKATLVGFKAGSRTILAKGPDPCRAYQELKKTANTSLNQSQSR